MSATVLVPHRFAAKGWADAITESPESGLAKAFGVRGWRRRPA